MVGGTNYYVESLLWETPMLLLDPASSATATAVSDVGAANQVADAPLIGKEGGGGGDETSGGMSLHERLRLVDPVMADRLHPNDTRKILNSLQVRLAVGIARSEPVCVALMVASGLYDTQAYARHGRPHSELLEEQAQQQQAGGGGAVQLFERSAMVWLDCDDIVLRPRLDRRYVRATSLKQSVRHVQVVRSSRKVSGPWVHNGFMSPVPAMLCLAVSTS